MKRVGDYAIEYFLTPLNTVARLAKEMPAKYINKEGNGVTPAFLEYARPLIGEMPVAERLQADRVKPILNKKKK
jgi:6-phosphofructokinase 1